MYIKDNGPYNDLPLFGNSISTHNPECGCLFIAKVHGNWGLNPTVTPGGLHVAPCVSAIQKMLLLYSHVKDHRPSLIEPHAADEISQ